MRIFLCFERHLWILTEATEQLTIITLRMSQFGQWHIFHRGPELLFSSFSRTVTMIVVEFLAPKSSVTLRVMK